MACQEHSKLVSKLRLEPRSLGFPSRVPSIPPCGLSWVDPGKTILSLKKKNLESKGSICLGNMGLLFVPSYPRLHLNIQILEKGFNPRAQREVEIEKALGLCSLEARLTWCSFRFGLCIGNSGYSVNTAVLRGLRDLSSPTRDQTHTLTVKVWSPNHWTTKEYPSNL